MEVRLIYIKLLKIPSVNLIPSMTSVTISLVSKKIQTKYKSEPIWVRFCIFTPPVNSFQGVYLLSNEDYSLDS
jgi:hypothetical protein